MQSSNMIREKIIRDIYSYNIQSLHENMIKYIDTEELQNVDIFHGSVIVDIFDAYQNKDYLRLADLLEYGNK